MLGWMLVWSILNGGIVESNLVFETREACLNAGESFGNMRPYFVDENGELQKQPQKSTPFRCLPVNAKNIEYFDLSANKRAIEARATLEKALEDAFKAERWKGDILHQMTTRITSKWTRPPAFSGGLEVFLRFDLKPNGELTSVRVLKSSGSEAFDLSAMRAVKAAAPFVEVDGLDSVVFKESFESLTVKFRPED